MNKPLFPNRDFANLQSDFLRSLARAAVAVARGTLDRGINVGEFAQKSWPDDPVVPLVLRAATSPAALSNTPALAIVATVFLESLIPISAAADLLNRGLSLRFDGAATISLPAITQPNVDFVGEGQPIPVQQLATSATTTEPHKLSSIIGLTGEMVRNSNAEAIVRNAMITAVGLALDKLLLSNTAGTTGLRPPGLLYGITPLTATPAGQDALVGDVKKLVSAIAPVAGNGSIVLVAAPGQATSLKFAVREPFPVLMSASLADGTVIAVATSALASAIDPPVIDASQEAISHQETAPREIVDIGNTSAYPVRSFFQTDSLGLRLRMPAS
jgi:hypothetical protein